MFAVSTKYPLSQETSTNYYDIAYDDYKIYICSDNKQIHVVDDTHTILKSITTQYPYHTLCYDNSNSCFWAASPESPDVLFKLSDTLEDVTEIELSAQENRPSVIQCLFYDATSKHLFAAEHNRIYMINPVGNFRLFYELKELTETPLKIFSLPDRFMCLTQSGQQVHLKQFSRANGKVLDDQILGRITQANSFAATQIHLLHPDFSLLLLGEEQENGLSLFELKQELSDVQMQQLGRNFMCSPFWVSPPGQANMNRTFPRCPSPPPCPPCPPCPDCGENTSSCGDSCCQNPCCRHHACTQVIESVALTETSIAHILNAEGEKLQKAIACCSCINDLLKINESVLRTIVHSTQLEQMLFYKLDAVLREENCGCQGCTPSCRCQEINAPDEDNASTEL